MNPVKSIKKSLLGVIQILYKKNNHKIMNNLIRMSLNTYTHKHTDTRIHIHTHAHTLTHIH